MSWWQRAWARSCPPSARETGLSIIITTALPPKVRDGRVAGCAGESRRFPLWAAHCTRALPGPLPPATPGKGGRKGDLPREVPGVTENCLSQKQSSPLTPAFNVTFLLLLLLLWQSAEWRLESSTPSHPLWNWVAGIFFCGLIFFLLLLRLFLKDSPSFIIFFLYLIDSAQFLLKMGKQKTKQSAPMRANRFFLDNNKKIQKQNKKKNFYLQDKTVYKIISPSHPVSNTTVIE